MPSTTAAAEDSKHVGDLVPTRQEAQQSWMIPKNSWQPQNQTFCILRVRELSLTGNKKSFMRADSSEKSTVISQRPGRVDIMMSKNVPL